MVEANEYWASMVPWRLIEEMGEEQGDGAASGAEVKDLEAAIACGRGKEMWVEMSAQESGKVRGSERGFLPIIAMIQMRQSMLRILWLRSHSK